LYSLPRNAFCLYTELGNLIIFNPYALLPWAGFVALASSLKPAAGLAALILNRGSYNHQPLRPPASGWVCCFSFVTQAFGLVSSLKQQTPFCFAEGG